MIGYYRLYSFVTGYVDDVCIFKCVYYLTVFLIFVDFLKTIAIVTPCEHIDNCLYMNTYLHIDKRRYITYRYLSIYFCW